MVKSKTQAPANRQAKKFIDKARELGCDEDEAAFDAKLKTVTGQKPKIEKDEAPDN